MAKRSKKKVAKGWAKKKPIQAYRGVVSLPFEPGKHKRIATKIVDDRRIESLKVMDIG